MGFSSQTSIKNISDDLARLREQRRKLLSEAASIETQIIGLKLELEKHQELQKNILESQKYQDHSEAYDE